MGEPISIITNWAKLNQGKSQIRAASMKAFQSFQEGVQGMEAVEKQWVSQFLSLQTGPS